MKSPILKKREKQKLRYVDTKSKERVLVAGDIHGDYESVKIF